MIRSLSHAVRPAVLLILCVMVSTLAFTQSDKEGAKDYPGISRMPGYVIYDRTDAQFDSAAFPITKNGKQSEETVEGRKLYYHYIIKEGTPATSTLQVVRNYQNAARTAGGQILHEASFDSGGRRETTLRFTKDGKEVWMYLETRSDAHWLTIIEKQAMQQEVTINAEAMGNDLRATGRVAVYGIYFDSGKSEVKPESDPALAEIAKLLKQDPRLKVFIVGHTDMVGDSAMNVKLSQARAQSVVTALSTKHGVAVTRLVAFGNGPYAPVATNKNDEGRAKNRRVELVEIATN